MEKREKTSESQGRCGNGRQILLPMNSKAAIITEPMLTKICSSASPVSLQWN